MALLVNGVLYRRGEGDKLRNVAFFFGADPSDIVEFEPNQLPTDALSGGKSSQVPAGALVFIQGGDRPLVEWAATDSAKGACSFWYPTIPARCIAKRSAPPD
jgi:hypothetical protein